MAIEIIKTHNTKGFVYFNKIGEMLSNKTETRLICTPGTMPVKVPTKQPSASANKTSGNMLIKPKSALIRV